MDKSNEFGWTVRHVTVANHSEEEAGLAYTSVTLSENVGGGRLIEVQLALDPEEQVDGYCIVDAALVNTGDALTDVFANANHGSLYGGVIRCEVENTDLRFSFNSEAQSIFQWPPILTLHLALDDVQRSTLIEGLRTVLSHAPEGEVVDLRKL